MVGPVGPSYLLSLLCEHAVLDAEDGGDVDVLLTQTAEPGGQGVQQSRQQNPAEPQRVGEATQCRV